MKGYKGFDEDFKCLGLQYEVGKTATYNGATLLCNRGLHFCEHPLDTWSYYPPLKSRYAEVEGDGVSDQTGEDSKRVAQSLTVKAEVKIPALLKAAVEFVFKSVTATVDNSAHSATVDNSAHSATVGYSAHSATVGNSAHSVTVGYSAHSATVGPHAHSVTVGNYAHSATVGNSAHSATVGNYAHSVTVGYSAHSATVGPHAHSVTVGNFAHSVTVGPHAHSVGVGNYAQSSAMGPQSIASSFGYQGRAKGALGNWIVLAEWKDGKIAHMGLARIDGKKIKADTFYILKGGKFTEVQ